jgi:ribosomal protein S18 acetylase RimI-like enzyme
VSIHADIEIVEITDGTSFEQIPPCADPRFDHRSCDYWEDEVRGSKSARPSWWQAPPPPTSPPAPVPSSDNPFAPRRSSESAFNPFDPAATADEPAFNPFAPESETADAAAAAGPRKLRLLDRGQLVFGSYAKVLLDGGRPAAYVQFGPLSAYPRARHVRELYPRLPSAPLPAVITCIASTTAARGQGLAQTLIEDVVSDLAARGFSAIETYPDLTLGREEASAATPSFWESCGFELAAADERYPVMRRELG